MRLFPSLCLLAACAGFAVAAGAQPKPPPLEAAPAPAVPGAKPLPGGGQPMAGPGVKPPPLPPGSDPFGAAPGARRAVASGTAFVVAPGRLLTNWHVVQPCTESRIRTSRGAELPATLVARDEARDLALLSVAAAGEVGPPLTFRSGPEIRRGEGVVTYGFPFAGMLSAGATLTTGDVSALSGLRDNQRHFQISAPVQAGNSGGPLLDMAGRVIGVVVSKLNAQRIAQVTGDLPQNVNFAVKGQEALDFLQRNGVRPATAVSGRQSLTPADVGDLAEPSTVLLRCLR